MSAPDIKPICTVLGYVYGWIKDDDVYISTVNGEGELLPVISRRPERAWRIFHSGINPALFELFSDCAGEGEISAADCVFRWDEARGIYESNIDMTGKKRKVRSPTALGAGINFYNGLDAVMRARMISAGKI